MIIDTSSVYTFNELVDVYYLDDYMPFSHSHAPGEFDRRIMNIKSNSTQPNHIKSKQDAIRYFTNKLHDIVHGKCVICRVPRSHVGANENGIYYIAKNLSRSKDFILDGTDCLVRFKTVPTAHVTGNHSESAHYNSIRVVNTKLIACQNILLLDDVITYGSSMSACRRLLIEAGANSVIGLAMGRTVR